MRSRGGWDRELLGWPRPGDPVPRLAWTPSVRPSYGRHDPLPPDVEREAFRRGLEWFARSRLIVHRDRLDRAPRIDPDDPTGPLSPADAPRGDGRDGILEGFASMIRAIRLLRRIGEDLVALQDPCGALREELGPPGKGPLPPPASNDAYGCAETSIIQANGDPLCDMLYTSNFAFLGLQEAAAATGESLFIDAEEKLAKFLCPIQIRSEAQPAKGEKAWLCADEIAVR